MSHEPSLSSRYALVLKFIRFVDQLNEKVGRGLSWLLVAMAVLTFIIVVLRYVFSLGWVWLQELVVYFHAILFLATSAYALKENGHVRVDILFEQFSQRRKEWVNLLGQGLLLIPTVGLVFWVSFPYVMDSWSVLEASPDSSGLKAVFILKSFILVFSTLLFLQSSSSMVRSFLKIKGVAVD